MNTLLSWTRQPTTITGLATLAGTVSAVLGGQLTTANALPLLIGALLSIAMPDNYGARLAVTNLVTDAVKAEQLIVRQHGGLAGSPTTSETTTSETIVSKVTAHA